MGKTKNRTEKIKREIEELNHQLLLLKSDNQALKDENEALRRSLRRRDTAVVFSAGGVPSSPLQSTGGTFAFSSGKAEPFGTGVSAPLIGFYNPFSGGKTSSFGESTCVAQQSLSFSGTTPIVGSSNVPSSDTPPIFGSTNPFSTTTSIFGPSNTFLSTPPYTFGAVRPKTDHLALPRTMESETIVSTPVRREPRRFRRVNRERVVVGETSTDEVVVERVVVGDPNYPSIDTTSSSSFTHDEELSKDDHVTDGDGEDVHNKGVEINDATMSDVTLPEANAICDEENVALEVVGEIAKPKVVQEIGSCAIEVVDCETAKPKVGEEIGSFARDCSCNGEVEAIEEEESEEIGRIDDFVEEGDKIEKLPDGTAFGISLSAGMIAEDHNAKPETFSDENFGALDGELGRAELVEEEVVSNQQGQDELNKILPLNEANMMGKEEVYDALKRLREKEEGLYAMLLEKDNMQRKLDELKSYVNELEQDKISHRNQIHQLCQEANEQLRMSDAMKEDAERKLETTQSEYKAILREKEEVEWQLVQMHTITSELQQENKSQRDKILKLQKGAKTGRRRKLWQKVSSFFVFAATSVAFILCRL